MKTLQKILFQVLFQSAADCCNREFFQFLVARLRSTALLDGTNQQAERVMLQLSSKKVSCWRCKGCKRGGGAYERWHITSTDLHEASFPCLNTIIDRHFTHAVSFHGFSEDKILIGGRANDALKQEVQQATRAVVAQSNISVEIAEPAVHLVEMIAKTL